MPEESFQEKTEKATPRKRREARKEGNVPKSSEVNSAVVLLTGMVALKMFGPAIYEKLTTSSQWIFSNLSVMEVTVENLKEFVIKGMMFMVSLLTPIVIMILIAGVGSNIIQHGLIFSAKPMAPKMSKISPLKGFKRIFGIRSLLEVTKGLMKLIIVGIIGYVTLKNELHVLPVLIDKDVAQIVVFVSGMSYKLAMRASMFLLVLAALDYAYQKYDYEKKLRMTKQEVKEEFKRSEGDPLIKSRIRSIQMKQARQRMFSEVPKADVVITNPIHLAVALKYESKKMAAPVVVAKGARLVAERIKEIARKHDVPVVENKPVARMIYKTTEIGSGIPFELYKAVAEILATVYRLRKKRA